MKAVTLTELKNNYSQLMDLVKRGKTSLLVFERDTPIIKVVFAMDGKGLEVDPTLLRLERAGLVRRATKPQKISFKRVVLTNKKGDILQALLANRSEDV